MQQNLEGKTVRTPEGEGRVISVYKGYIEVNFNLIPVDRMILQLKDGNVRHPTLSSITKIY